MRRFGAATLTLIAICVGAWFFLGPYVDSQVTYTPVQVVQTEPAGYQFIQWTPTADANGDAWGVTNKPVYGYIYQVQAEPVNADLQWMYDIDVYDSEWIGPAPYPTPLTLDLHNLDDVTAEIDKEVLCPFGTHHVPVASKLILRGRNMGANGKLRMTMVINPYAVTESEHDWSSEGEGEWIGEGEGEPDLPRACAEGPYDEGSYPWGGQPLDYIDDDGTDVISTVASDPNPDSDQPPKGYDDLHKGNALPVNNCPADGLVGGIEFWGAVAHASGFPESFEISFYEDSGSNTPGDPCAVLGAFNSVVVTPNYTTIPGAFTTGTNYWGPTGPFQVYVFQVYFGDILDLSNCDWMSIEGYGNTGTEEMFLWAATDQGPCVIKHCAQTWGQGDTGVGYDFELAWCLVDALELDAMALTEGDVPDGGIRDEYVDVTGGTGPYAYQWYFEGTGTANLLTGETTTIYTNTAVTSADDGRMYVAVTDSAASPQLRWANDTDGVFWIAYDPEGGTVCGATPFTFEVVASGGEHMPYVYQWYKDGTTTAFAIADATLSTLTLTPTLTADGGDFYVSLATSMVYGAIPALYSAAASLTVIPAPGCTLAPVSGTRYAGEAFSFTTTATPGTGTIIYQWYKQDPNGTFYAVTDATLSNLTFTAVVTEDTATYYCKYGDDNFGADPKDCDWIDTANVTLEVSCADWDDGDLAIHTAPVGGTPVSPAPFTFFVSVTAGTPPYTYQWYKNCTSSAIADATNSVYTITAVTSAHYGNYTVEVTDDAAATGTPVPVWLIPIIP